MWYDHSLKDVGSITQRPSTCELSPGVMCTLLKIAAMSERPLLFGFSSLKVGLTNSAEL